MLRSREMPAVLELIRTRTRALHSQLEERIDLQRALSSRAEYRSLLGSHLGLYRPFESMLAAQPPFIRDLIQWPECSKLPPLERDMHSLGATADQIEQIPDCPDLPKLDNIDAVLGALYVIEGSALGGQIIYRQIETSLHLDKDTGASFFFGQGTNTGSNWKAFIGILEEHVNVPEESAQTACAMFQSFEGWLTQRTTSQELQ